MHAERYWVGTDDFTFKAILDQFRHPSDVIDMGMGEKQVVDPVRRNRPVFDTYARIVALGQAAVHHDIQTVRLKQVAGAGNAVFGTEME